MHVETTEQCSLCKQTVNWEDDVIGELYSYRRPIKSIWDRAQQAFLYVRNLSSTEYRQQTAVFVNDGGVYAL